MIGRLDKILSAAGLGTRKEVKRLIRSGRIKTGTVICRSPEQKFDTSGTEIFLDSVKIDIKDFTYIMLNKPGGVISATQDKTKSTVLDLMPEKYKGLFPVGRLDIDTQGLLILTDDGILTHRLTAPGKNVEKIYYLELENPWEKDYGTKIEEGLLLSDGYKCLPGRAWPENPEPDCNKGFIAISEGKFHQVKKMFFTLGNYVTFLKRVQIGNVKLDKTLSPGEFRHLTDAEVESLKKSSGLLLPCTK